MEIKKFDEYTNEEQVNLLFHWWNYYGKVPITLDEIEMFQNLLKEDLMFVKNVAVIENAIGKSSQNLISAMRKNEVEQYRNKITKITEDKRYAEDKEALEELFIEEIVRTYNNPKPPVPMSDEQIVQALTELKGEKVGDFTIVNISLSDQETDHILTADKVSETYRECLFASEEVKKGKPLCDFVIGQGVMNNSVFHSERLEKNKDKIVSMVDELYDIEKGPLFVKLCNDKNGRQWADCHFMIDLLVQLGTAVGALSFPLDKALWPFLPGNVPFVMRDHTKDNEHFVVHKPKEFTKVKKEVTSGTYKKDAE